MPDYISKLWSVYYYLANIELTISSKCPVYILIMGLKLEFDFWLTAFRNSLYITSKPLVFDTFIAQLLNKDIY